MKRRSVDLKGNKEDIGFRWKKKKQPVSATEMESETEFTSTSAKKLHGASVDVPCDETFAYCIVNFAAIFLGIAECLVCRKCGGDVKFAKKSIRGLGFKLVIFCIKCKKDIKTINSSPVINRLAYEINRRFAFTMRVLGKGLRAMQLFCGLMDMPTCISQRPYDAIMTNVVEAAKTIAETSMKCAAQKELSEAKKQTDLELVENGIIVSGDGTWMKRGFSSLFGVATLIGNFSGKVIDFVVKSSYCKDCEFHQSNLDSGDFDAWFEEHQSSCSINHQGSAGKMEPDAILTMFQRSEDLYGVKYQYYVGDGDSKTFSAISTAKPYNDIEVKKKECIGHVQKRMGSRLRKLITDNKNTKEPGPSNQSRRSSLSGKGKLTKKLIDELTIYYGLAIRNNINFLEDMRNAIWATFYHKISTNENPQHFYCPPGKDSWCYWQKAMAEGLTIVHKAPLHEMVQTAIEPIYTALSSDDLLKKCLGGYTQNSNESLNAKIWKLAPKCTPGSNKIVNTATSIAVSTYNDGSYSYLQILHLLGVTIGNEAHRYCQDNNANRLKCARIQTYQSSKQARIDKKIQKTVRNNVIQEKEGTHYEAGMAE